MERKDFYKSRHSYQVFEPCEVYKHIDQEARRRRRMDELIRVRDEKFAEEEKKKKNKNKRSRKWTSTSNSKIKWHSKWKITSNLNKM